MTRRRTTTVQPPDATIRTADAMANLIVARTTHVLISGVNDPSYMGTELTNALDVMRLRNPRLVLDADLATKNRSPLYRLLRQAVQQAESEARYR